MSLIDLNPKDDSAAFLPRYDTQLFEATVTTNELSNYGWANDVTNSNDLFVASQPNFYRNSLDANAAVTNLSFSAVTNYVFIFRNVDSNWTLIQTIDSVGDDRDNFGYSVSFSKTSGAYLAIGTYNRTSGAALSYVYVSDLGSPPVYTLQTTFDTGTFGTIANDTTNIGVKVQLNAAGDHLLIMGTTGIIEQFSRSGVTWTHDTGDTIAAIPTYATASAALIGLDADANHAFIVRGCPLFPVGAAFSAQTGQVDVFQNSTTAIQTFVGGAGDRIGAAVAISSNGLFMAYSAIELAVELDLRLIDTSGYVNIYNTSGGTFSLQQQITGLSVKSTTGSFGSDLALTAFGNTLVVGDAFTNNYSGSAYVFARSDDIWTLAYELGANQLASEVVVLDATNNVITVTLVSSVTTSVTLTPGSYTGTTLATELTTEMTSQTADTYTVTYDNVGLFFNIVISASTFKVEAVGTINSVLGFSTTTDTSFGASNASSVLPSFSYNGTELGRNVNLSESVAAFVSGGYPGREGPSPDLVNGVGAAMLSVFSTEANNFQSAVTIDTTDTEALLVRKNNDGGDVFTVDTRTGDGIVISDGILCANNVLDSTATDNGSLVVKGGVGIAKSVFVGGVTNTVGGLTVTANAANGATFNSGITSNLTSDFSVLSTTTIPSTQNLLAVQNTIYAVGSSFYIYDFTDKSVSPVLLGSVALGTTYEHFVVDEANKTAYVSDADSDTIKSVNINDPASPVVLDTITDATNLTGVNGIVLSGNYLFARGGFFTGGDYVTSIDVSDPANLIRVSTLKRADTTSGPTTTNYYGWFAQNFNANNDQSMYVIGTELIMLTGNGGIVIPTNLAAFSYVRFDISDPGNITETLGVLFSSTVFASFDVQRNFLYGVYNINLGTPRFIVVNLITNAIESTTTTVAPPQAIRVQNEYAYILTSPVFTSLSDPLIVYVYDISDPTAPVLVHTDTRVEYTANVGVNIQPIGNFLVQLLQGTSTVLNVIDIKATKLRALGVGSIETGDISALKSLTVSGKTEVLGSLLVASHSHFAADVTLNTANIRNKVNLKTVNTTTNPENTESLKKTFSGTILDDAGVYSSSISSAVTTTVTISGFTFEFGVNKIDTAAPHGIATGSSVYVQGTGGSTDITPGTWTSLGASQGTIDEYPTFVDLGGGAGTLIAVSPTAGITTTITTAAPHGLTTGNEVTISGTTATTGESINVTTTVTVTAGSTFTIPFGSNSGAGGTVVYDALVLGDLDFGGSKSFKLELYVSIDKTTDAFSHYTMTGVNETLSGNTWTSTTVRSGTTDPGLTLAVTTGGLPFYLSPLYTGYSDGKYHGEVLLNFL